MMTDFAFTKKTYHLASWASSGLLGLFGLPEARSVEVPDFPTHPFLYPSSLTLFSPSLSLIPRLLSSLVSSFSSLSLSLSLCSLSLSPIYRPLLSRGANA